MQTCTCIHSTVHESTMPTRRRRDGGRYVHVQACTCIQATEHKSIVTPCTTQRGGGGRYMYNMCRRAPTQHRAQGHYAYEAKASGGGGRYDCTSLCRRARAYTALCHESTMPIRRRRDGHQHVHVQTCACIHSTVHEGTRPTRRSGRSHGYVHVQTCTCRHSRCTVPESTMPTTGRRGGRRYVPVHACTCIYKLRQCTDACRASEAPVAHGRATLQDDRPPRPMAV